MCVPGYVGQQRAEVAKDPGVTTTAMNRFVDSGEMLVELMADAAPG